ncbi:ABC transporter ATP-binding protein [Pseudomonas sp. CGJS7]|uniref:ABC transporter ATP-binding protein n=1 Tax=Pseudomonas sp. CGJS7 TaxID=3109348 RepID=UPI003008C4D2
MSTSALIQLTKVQKIFLTEDMETHALSDIDFHVDRGEFVSITGPSGCGKSTLMSILGTLDTATSGRYVLNGKEVGALDERERARVRSEQIGFVFQAFNLIGDLSIAENIEVPLTYRADVDKNERRKMAMEALDRVGMTHRAKHYPAQLSGGQQQRVAVARALVGRPSILLADEPTGNLDSKNGESVMQLLKELHLAGSTLCMVTHDPRYTEWADRQVFMFDGRIVSGSVDASTPLDSPAMVASDPA